METSIKSSFNNSQDPAQKEEEHPIFVVSPKFRRTISPYSCRKKDIYLLKLQWPYQKIRYVNSFSYVLPEWSMVSDYWSFPPNPGLLRGSYPQYRALEIRLLTMCSP